MMALAAREVADLVVDADQPDEGVEVYRLRQYDRHPIEPEQGIVLNHFDVAQPPTNVGNMRLNQQPSARASPCFIPSSDSSACPTVCSVFSARKIDRDQVSLILAFFPLLSNLSQRTGRARSRVRAGERRGWSGGRIGTAPGGSSEGG